MFDWSGKLFYSFYSFSCKQNLKTQKKAFFDSILQYVSPVMWIANGILHVLNQ